MHELAGVGGGGPTVAEAVWRGSHQGQAAGPPHLVTLETSVASKNTPHRCTRHISQPYTPHCDARYVTPRHTALHRAVLTASSLPCKWSFRRLPSHVTVTFPRRSAVAVPSLVKQQIRLS
ncbi:hypothetical protein E2C01_040826 [Portunus trituberculatus]|uniref:Uncharacterized protein n=1 Tax=Portunus trituberculatus TaxID=210409 RepID=A0A5B7FIF3_PORTR|nr:hypothetical protein [Portunus trituberculatus]